MVYLLKLINLSGKVYMIVNSSNAKMYIYTFVYRMMLIAFKDWSFELK